MMKSSYNGELTLQFLLSGGEISAGVWGVKENLKSFKTSKVNICFFFCQGTLEDWDIAVQKTETRLARVNEQRVKVMNDTVHLKSWEPVIAILTVFGVNIFCQNL